MPAWLAVTVAAGTLIMMAAGVFVGLLALKSRADFAEFKADLLKVVGDKLDDYMTTKGFQTYSESHAKEHGSIHEEITRLRDFRHDMPAELRKVGADADDRMREEIRRIEEKD